MSRAQPRSTAPRARKESAREVMRELDRLRREDPARVRAALDIMGRIEASRARDPRVVEILAAFDRVATSPEASKPLARASLLAGFMHAVCGIEDGVVDRWPRASVRGLLLDVVSRCPAREVPMFLRLAQKEVRWIEFYERESAWEATHGTSYPGRWNAELGREEPSASEAAAA